MPKTITVDDLIMPISLSGEICETRLELACLDMERKPEDRLWGNRRGSISGKLRTAILEDFCRYCGGTSEEVDHYWPKSRGGTDDRSNLVAACYLCNRDKADMLMSEWRAWRIANGRPWPPPDTCNIRIKLISQLGQDEIHSAVQNDRLPASGKLPIQFLEVLWRFEKKIYNGEDAWSGARAEMTSWLRGGSSE